MDDLHTAAVKVVLQQCSSESVWHQLCPLCCWRNMLNKKAKSNQGENATLPPWGLCHLYFADNGEKSNENKWVAPCCRSLCLEGIWPTNDNNTSWNGLYWNEITRKKAKAEEKQAECACLNWEQSERKRWGEEKRFEWSIYRWRRVTDVTLPSKTYSAGRCGCGTTLRVKESHPLIHPGYYVQSNWVKIRQQPDSLAALPNIWTILDHQHDLLLVSDRLLRPQCPATLLNVDRWHCLWPCCKGFWGPESELTFGFNTIIVWSLRLVGGRAATPSNLLAAQSSAWERITFLGWLLADIYHQSQAEQVSLNLIQPEVLWSLNWTKYMVCVFLYTAWIYKHQIKCRGKTEK